MKYLLAFTIALVCAAGSVRAQTAVNFAWDANTDQVTVGYNLHVGTTSGNYTLVFPIAGESSNGISVASLTDNDIYFAVVKAFDASGIEGAPSNEIQIKSGTPLPPAGLHFTN